MQLATDQYVTVNVQLDKNKQQVRDTSSFTLYQDSYIDFVKLEKTQPEIAYKQIGDNITFEELVATEFQFPTAMSCDGYLAVQSLEKNQKITEKLIEQWYKDAVYLQQDEKDSLEYLGRQKFQIVLAKKDDEIFHFEAKDISDLLEQKSMMTSLSQAVRQLTQKIYNQLRDETDKHFSNDKFILNNNYLTIEDKHVPFNDYIYPLNVFKIENNQGQTNLKPHFNGTIKFKGISNYMNRVADDKEKYEHYVDIESNKMYQTNLNLSYPKFKIITPKTIRAIMLLKIGISLLKMQYIREAEIIFNEAVTLVEIQDVVLHYILQLYLYFISQLNKQTDNQDKEELIKLAKKTRILTCAGLGNVAHDILKYIQNQYNTNEEINNILKDNQAKIPQQTE
ncbi:Hypothetical_protein [Hexamita inflata]|uniref:Hypothetical_protein n=1 Tax=Hexamita inflata TaxID=28002 RepID=A0AA86TVK8_9EUKA|nr:Hypothetical protein HINF_LOCUS17806 [Hexamita inflata]